MRRRSSRAALAGLLLVAGCTGSRGGAAPTTPPTAPTAPTTPTAPVPATVSSPAAATTSPTSRARATLTPSPPPATPPARVDYAFPVAGCRVTYARAHHDYPATDLFARAGCAFVSPVDGRVHEVERRDRWDAASDRGADRGGRYVSVVGVDGVRYYGSHLRSVTPGLAPGMRVAAGDRLGEVGVSGSARETPPHLHFGISWPTRAGVWWVRRGVVAPWPYLDSWRAGGDRSPVAAVERARRDAGTDEPPCPADC